MNFKKNKFIRNIAYFHPIMNLKKIFSKIVEDLDIIDSEREKILVLSREMVRDCSVAIKSIHRKELNVYEQKIEEIKKSHNKIKNIIENNPAFFGTYLKTPEQEYMEAVCLHAIINDQDLPYPEEYGISNVNYLLGLADVIGELRRHVLDKIRVGEIENLEKLLEKMEDLYTHLFSLDYPKGITQDLRRKTDIARGIIEKTRGDISIAMQMNQLKNHLNEFNKN